MSQQPGGGGAACGATERGGTEDGEAAAVGWTGEVVGWRMDDGDGAVSKRTA